jgi:hypothetical protein
VNSHNPHDQLNLQAGPASQDGLDFFTHSRTLHTADDTPVPRFGA